MQSCSPSVLSCSRQPSQLPTVGNRFNCTPGRPISSPTTSYVAESCSQVYDRGYRRQGVRLLSAASAVDDQGLPQPCGNSQGWSSLTALSSRRFRSHRGDAHAAHCQRAYGRCSSRVAAARYTGSDCRRLACIGAGAASNACCSSSSSSAVENDSAYRAPSTASTATKTIGLGANIALATGAPTMTTPRASELAPALQQAGPALAPWSSTAAGAGVSAAQAVGGAAEGCCSTLVEDTTADTWRTPLRRPGSVVALGKFDALHRGHRALATAAASLAREIAVQPRLESAGAIAYTPVSDQAVVASTAAAGAASDFASGRGVATSNDGSSSSNGGGTAGEAVLLSFSGMGAVLGWPDRLPLTAPQDRGRVLTGWAQACAAGSIGHSPGDGSGGPDSGVATAAGAESTAVGPGPGSVRLAADQPPPRLRTMPFSLIRSMSPEQFVELLAKDLGAAGVVAGRNYRFGFKAAGDADMLVRLGRQYGLRVAIVDLVQLPDNYRTAGQVAGDGSPGAGAGLVHTSQTRSDDGISSSGISSSNAPDGGAGSSIGDGVGCSESSPNLRGRVSPGSGPGSSSSSSTNNNTTGLAGAAPSRSGAAEASSTSAATAATAVAASAAGGEVGCPPSPPPFDQDASTDLDVELEVAAPAVATATLTAGAARSGGGGGGGGRGGDNSTRVSSSRIRSLLENGQVECVEQLLGRKYRLVCDLRSASCSGQPALTDMAESSEAEGAGCTSANHGPGTAVQDAESAVRLVVPSAAYQNQPPTNGQYRALVRVVTSEKIDALSEGAVASIDGGSRLGEVCAVVRLSDPGLEVELPTGFIGGAQNEEQFCFLLVDFDTCGP